MKKTKYKCYDCGNIVDHIDIAYDYRGGDFLRCPACGAIEPGFTEIKEEAENGEQGSNQGEQ